MIPTGSSDTAGIGPAQQNVPRHIRSSAFLDVANVPNLTFTSTGSGATTPRFGTNHEGAMSVGVSARTVISRSEFGADLNMPMGTGGLLLSDDVEVILEIEGNVGV